jgi:hypothetical protein
MRKHPDPNAWNANGAHVGAPADMPHRFIAQHVASVLYQNTVVDNPRFGWDTVQSEEEFWHNSRKLMLNEVQLPDFTLTDWFPRAPGVFWSGRAFGVRAHVWSTEERWDNELGEYYSPLAKGDLIEDGGLGTIRLLPRKIDGEECWFATALKGLECHAGIPLMIPDRLLRRSGAKWGDRISLVGRVRFLHETGLQDTAASIHHARPLIVFVEHIERVHVRSSHADIVITPVALFDTLDESQVKYRYGRAGYAFVQCIAGSDPELNTATDWIERYVDKHRGQVITNFDQQRPILAGAPLSYQRLVDNSYDRSIVKGYAGNILIERIEQLHASITYQHIGDTHVGHKINVNGPAIINIDSVLRNVTQTIGDSRGLNPLQKTELESLIATMHSQLKGLAASHAEETKEIVDALEKAVSKAAAPSPEKKRSLLELSAKGLKDAAELVRDIAPDVAITAGQIAAFILGLRSTL